MTAIEPHRTLPAMVRHAVTRVGGMGTAIALRVAPRECVRAFAFLERRRRQSALALLSRHVRPGDVVVDVGAHRGVFTDELARLVGPRGRVHSFEPNPDSWRILRAVKGKRQRIELHQVGLSDHAGSATLYRPRPDGVRVDAMSSVAARHDLADVAYDPVTIELDRLDHALERESARISLIKIDVEGHELAVLHGAEGLLRRSRPTILVEIEQRHQDADIRETFDYLRGLGYDGSFLTTTGLRPLTEFDVRRHQTDLLPATFTVGRPAPGYVSDFLFVAASTPGETAATAE